MTTPQEVAISCLKRYIERGWELDAFLSIHLGQVSPAVNDQPAIWLTCGGILFPQRDGGEGIRLKKHQIGVAFYWPDGRAEHGIFDARKLWEEIVDPKPVQLSLF